MKFPIIKKNKNFFGLILLAPFLLVGCQSSSLYFATDTSVGLADVSGNAKVPNQIKFGFKRSELVIIPKQAVNETENNKLPSVVGTLDSDITWFSGSKIKEVYATGDAADCYAYQKAKVKLDKDSGTAKNLGLDKFQEIESCPTENSNKGAKKNWMVPKNNALIFEAHTAFSIAKIGYGETEAPNISILNFKRRVGSIIPLFYKDAGVRPVYSDFCFDSRPNETSKCSKESNQSKGTVIKHSYATGLAAVMAAKLVN